MTASPKRASLLADLDRLRTVFERVDAEGSGFIGEKELGLLARSVPGLEESMAAELMEKLDRDRDGKVSFSDFEALFEAERSAKRQLPLTPQREASMRESLFKTPYLHADTPSPGSQSLEFDTALESFPSEVVFSPTGEEYGGEKEARVQLRHKKTDRKTSEPVVLMRHLQSSDMPDLAEHVRSLSAADPFESPGQLHRRSKVLSWISESEDWQLDDVEASSTEVCRAPSPLPSPRRSHAGDELTHAKAVLESVCSTNEIGHDAITKLCSHVKADPQEQQELLLLLDQLDKQQRGWVSLEEFAQGLQAVRNAAAVTSTPSLHTIHGRRRRHSDQPLPKLSESFSTPFPFNSPGHGIPLVSTPLATPRKEVFEPLLSVLDLDSSGYVQVDNIVSHFQQMGLESPHDQSIEVVLQEAVPVDHTGRMSVSDLMASMEGAMVGEGKTHSVLRKAGLQSFKLEVSVLRSQVAQAQLERDKVKSKLNNTREEKRRLVREGDDNVEAITRESDKKIRELESHYNDRVKEAERLQREEYQQMQDQFMNRMGILEKNAEKLKTEEEKLREDLKYAEKEASDVTERLSQANAELDQKDRFIDGLQKDLELRQSEQGSMEDMSQLSRLKDLQRECSERAAHVQELQVSIREHQDRMDELVAEREEWKQKYTAQKRKLQRKRSFGSKQQSTSRKHRRHPSKEEKSLRKIAASTDEDASQSPVKLASLDLVPTDSSPSPHREEVNSSLGSGASTPVTPPHQDSIEFQEVDVQHMEATATPPWSSSDHEETPTSSDDLFARSSASLLEEFQHEDSKVSLEKKISKLRKEKAELETFCKDLECQLQALEKDNADKQEELDKELSMKKQKQAKPDELLCTLESQHERLSLTRREIEAQLVKTEEMLARQSVEIRSVTSPKANSAESRSEPHIEMLQGELEHMKQELEMANTQLVEQKRRHEEAVLRLSQNIAVLEKENLIQVTRREEDLGKLSAEVHALQQANEQEKDSHAKEVNRLRKDAENKLHAKKIAAEKQLQGLQGEIDKQRCKSAGLETVLNNTNRALSDKEMALASVQHTLDSLQQKVNQYKLKTSELELELKQASSTLSATEQALVDTQKEVADMKTSFPVGAAFTPMPLAPSPESSDSGTGEATQLKVSLEELEHNHAESLEARRALEAELTASKIMYDQEVSRLTSRVNSIEMELSEQAQNHKDATSQLKEDMQKQIEEQEQLAELKIAEAKEESQRQITLSKQLSELQLESSKQKLKTSEHCAREFQAKWEASISEYDTALMQLSELREQESCYERELSDFRAKEVQLQYEIERLRADSKHQLEELETSHNTEQEYKEQIASLREELAGMKHSPPIQDVEETTDFFMPSHEIIQRSPYPLSPSRLSHHSDQSVHDELISQMKTQLEGLQNILASQGKGGLSIGEEELSLIQELLLNNSRLQSELKHERESREHDHVVRALDFTSPNAVVAISPSHLHSKRQEERALQSVVSSLVMDLSSMADSLQAQCSTSFNGCSQRVSNISTLVALLAERLSEKERQHAVVVGNLTDELDKSRIALDSYRFDVDLLKSGLDLSQEDLNRSRGEVEHLQRTRDTEVQTLKTELRRVKSLKGERDEKESGRSAREVKHLARSSSFSGMESRSVMRSNTETRGVKKTEGGSNQSRLRVEHRDRLQMEELLRKKESEVESLIENLKQATAREVALEKRDREMDDRLRQKERELTSKAQSISVLERKLGALVSEPVEVIIQYREAIPLESVNDAALHHMKPTGLTAETVPVELTPLVQKPMPESDLIQLSAVQQSLHEAERRLRAEQEVMEEKTMEYQRQLQQAQLKHENELSEVQQTLIQQTKDLSGIYRLLVESENEEPDSHHQIVLAVRGGVERLKTQALLDQQLVQELEETLHLRQEEYDQAETQFQAEHEEEVRALRQQKRHVLKQKDDLKKHYQQLLTDQDKQNSTLLQDLFNSRSQMEAQVCEAQAERQRAECHVTNLLEEKKALMDIIQQLSLEAGRHLDILVSSAEA